MNNKEIEHLVKRDLLARTEFSKCCRCKKNGHAKEDCWHERMPQHFKSKDIRQVQNIAERVNNTQADEDTYSSGVRL